MKLTGLTGTGSGKLGSSVFSVSAGEQIVRQYQPVVTNPSTASQVNNRARMKLLSQLSAVFADVIAIPRQGLLSPRNLFVSDNYPATSAVNGVASANLSALGLTRGGIQIPAVVAERVDATSISASLARKADQIVSRVIYIMFYRNTAGALQLVDSAVVETAGADGTFPYSFPWQERDVIIYAYGIFDKNAKATAKFGDYNVTTGTQIASLIADRKVSDSDYLLSKTRGILLAGEIHIEVTQFICNQVNVPATGSTTIPYDSSVAIEVAAVDVEGKVLAAYVDGVLGEMRAFLQDGTSYVGAFDLVGGENIVAKIGHMENGTFVPEFTYGGTMVIGAQSSAFTEILANGVNIANSGTTQVAQEEDINFETTAAGVNGKYLRVSVNGVARTPVAFQNGMADDGILAPNIGDQITFQIGRMVNGTFVQDVAYGGTAVVAEVPAEFTGVSVNGTTIAPNNTTNVNAQATNTYVIGSLNASGKYLAIMDANNVVLSVHAFTGNSLTITDSTAAGNSRKLAIGTGSSVGSFVAQTNFGGTIAFVEHTIAEFVNVQVGGSPLNADKLVNAGTYNFSGSTELTGISNNKAFFVKQVNKPALGVATGYVAAETNISNGDFSGSLNVNYHDNLWLCIGNYDGDTTWTITAVYDYKVWAEGDPDN